VNEIAGERLELCLAVTNAAGVERGQRSAMIRVVAADRFVAEFAPAFVFLILAGDLETRLVRFRSRVDEVDVIVATQQRIDLFC
jgi:hypothetical protein